MLLKPLTLISALTRFNHRNELIKQLDCSDVADKNNFYKLVMAFWLGSNVTLNTLNNQFRIINFPSFAYIYQGYYCILILDKQISLLESSSAARQVLQKVLNDIFLFYNTNYLLLNNKPESLFLSFISSIEKISIDSIPVAEHRQLVEITKKNCLNLLSKAMHYTNVTELCEPDVCVTQPSNDLIGINWINPRKLNIGILKFQTAAFQRRLFGSEFTPTNGCHLHRFLLPASDGVLLEGTLIRNTKQKTKTVVLALVGHFPIDDYYISIEFKAFHKLFNTDVVFINHRNFSIHSNKFANKIDEIVDDIVSFADYFRQRNKHLVLYGMCGGAAHMILAANKLLEKNIPFKLIIDRFPQQYENFFDVTTQNRYRNYIKSKTVTTPFVSNIFLFISIVLFIMMLLKIGLYISKTNYNFAALARKIPEQDLLILQAKGLKLPGQHEPNCTDFIVHPKHDIRYAFKDIRNQRKLLLQTLGDYSLKISGYAIFSTEMQSIFLRFFSFFDLSLQLIQNEKLTLKNSPNQAIDLHSFKLFELTTRNNQEISTFINGFFKKSAISTAKYIKLLNYSSEELIIHSLIIDYHDPQAMYNAQNFAHYLSLFLKTIQENEPYISNTADRLYASQMGNIIDLIKVLLATDLFKQLSKNHDAILTGSYN